jgi:hypothetical protein
MVKQRLEQERKEGADRKKEKKNPRDQKMNKPVKIPLSITGQKIKYVQISFRYT